MLPFCRIPRSLSGMAESAHGSVWGEGSMTKHHHRPSVFECSLYDKRILLPYALIAGVRTFDSTPCSMSGRKRFSACRSRNFRKKQAKNGVKSEESSGSSRLNDGLKWQTKEEIPLSLSLSLHQEEHGMCMFVFMQVISFIVFVRANFSPYFTFSMEHIPIEEVFDNLKCTKEGLKSEEAQRRLEIFGYNKLEEKQESKFLKFLGFMWNPLSWVMEFAAIMAIALANGGNKPPDWQDFVGIIALLIINSTISFIEENNAGNAAAALMARLAPKAKVLRDGHWTEEDAAILVPGDIVSIKLGDIVPADARLLKGDPLKIDQSALTGESLPVTKCPGDEVYSGSTCKQGEIEAVVIATGVRTFFGKAAHLVDSTNHVGHFQKVLTAIGNFCICSIVVGMIIEIIVMYPIQHRAYRPGIDNLLVLLIGGIPIAMPTVLSVTMAIGSHRLSEQGAITKRMTAIEEMAGMDVLCSDKTGTLTLNKLTVDKNLIEVFSKQVDVDIAVRMAARASRIENQDAIDAAIVGMLADPKEARAGIEEVHFLPFNPTDKRTALTYIDSQGKMHRVTKGAPEQILNLARNKSEIEGRVHAVIDKFADRGFIST
ncbi:hypothetical protein Leryth_014962 [Lithospermum erythrorhizon]|nr:hypothetical protein Leryth_014962 [Lithospermum erythrorhizon]